MNYYLLHCSQCLSNANNRHLISHPYLTTSNWIMPVCTSQSLPPLRPCLPLHFRQGLGASVLSASHTPDFPSYTKCQRQPPRQYALSHESLAHPPHFCPPACITQNCPALGILPPRRRLGFAIHSALLRLSLRVCGCTDPLVPHRDY